MKRAYLTIDDGPSADTHRKLKVLARHSLKAQWYCLGENIERYEAVVIRAIADGHLIGSHSYDHSPYSELSVEEGIEQMRKTDALIDAAYARAGAVRTEKLFRFPKGDIGSGNPVDRSEKTERFQIALRELGYACPRFPDLTHAWWHEEGHAESAHVYATFIIPDKSLLLEKDGIATISDVLEAMESNQHGSTLNSSLPPSSAEIILMHDFAELPDTFDAIIEKLVTMNLELSVR